MKERLRFELGFLEIGRKREPGESAMRVILDHKSDDPASMVMSEAGVPQSLSPWNHSRGKRMFDFVAAGVVLLPCLPLMALIAAAVAVTSRGPVLFRQKRVGENERAIELLKFRTMLHNLGSAGPGVTRSGDPRITPIGRFLRRCKLDELPQLLNVLRGDMSAWWGRVRTLRKLPGARSRTSVGAYAAAGPHGLGDTALSQRGTVAGCGPEKSNSYLIIAKPFCRRRRSWIWPMRNVPHFWVISAILGGEFLTLFR